MEAEEIGFLELLETIKTVNSKDNEVRRLYSV
jgi:hypothetical protein